MKNKNRSHWRNNSKIKYQNRSHWRNNAKTKYQSRYPLHTSKLSYTFFAWYRHCNKMWKG